MRGTFQLRLLFEQIDLRRQLTDLALEFSDLALVVLRTNCRTEAGCAGYIVMVVMPISA